MAIEEDVEGTVSITDGTLGAGAADARGTLVLALHCGSPLAPSRAFALQEASHLVVGRGAGPPGSVDVQRRDGLVEVRLADPRISSRHFEIHRIRGDFLLEDSRSKNGTLLDGRFTQRAQLPDGAVVQAGETLFVFRRATLEDRGTPSSFSAAMSALGQDLRRIACSRLPVLLLGATGTGKELAAADLHTLSQRSGALVAVNCAALPSGLAESQLFGHRKGAFSGATEDRPGYLRAADRGTLFLDEVGELSLAAQAALLRAIESSEVVPLGDTRPVQLDLRVVAATNRDLGQMMKEGAFRPDLFARLAGFTVRLPPLVERREDLGLIIASLLRQVAPCPENVTFAPRAARALFAHDWPLNIRELHRCLQAATLLADEGRIDLAHLPPHLRHRSEPGNPVPESPPARTDDEEERRKFLLEARLREHHGNVSRVARALNTGRTQIQRLARRYGLDIESFRH